MDTNFKQNVYFSLTRSSFFCFVLFFAFFVFCFCFCFWFCFLFLKRYLMQFGLCTSNMKRALENNANEKCNCSSRKLKKSSEFLMGMYKLGKILYSYSCLLSITGFLSTKMSHFIYNFLSIFFLSKELQNSNLGITYQTRNMITGAKFEGSHYMRLTLINRKWKKKKKYFLLISWSWKEKENAVTT